MLDLLGSVSPYAWQAFDAVKPYAPFVLGGGLALYSASNLLTPKLEKNGWLTAEGARNHGLTGGDVPLGKVGLFFKETITAPKESFVFAVGPTGSGKTKNLIENIIFGDKGNSMVVFDLKGDLLKATAHHRSTLGPVYVLDTSGGPTNHYNPYVDIPVGNLSMLRNFHMWLAPEVGKRGENPFYNAKGDVAMYTAAAHILQCGGFEKSLAGVCKLLVNTPGWDTILKESPIDAVRERAAGFTGKVLGEIPSTVSRLMDWVFDEHAAKVISKSDLRLTDMQAGPKPCTIYIRLPEQSRETMMPFARAVIGMLTMTLMGSETHSLDGREKVRGVTFIIDEVKQLALPKIETFLSAGRSFGGRVIMASQLVSEVRELYGPSVEGNCTTHLFFRTQSIDEAEHISETLPKRTIIKERVTHSIGTRGRTKSVNKETVEEPLLTPTGVMKLTKHKDIVGVVDGYPVRMRSVYSPKEYAAVRGKPFTVQAYDEVPNPWGEAKTDATSDFLLQDKPSAPKAKSRRAYKPRAKNMQLPV